MVIARPFMAAALLLGSTMAYPAVDIGARQADDHSYQKPGPSDSRAPCPALNTLANHGFLPRNGRGISRQNFQDAFLDGFGVANDVLVHPITNAFTTCFLVTGRDCGDSLDNLTLLAEPHIFEHDHSISREDYHMAYKGPDGFANNQNFNLTVWINAIEQLGGTSHMNFSQANEMRLQREAFFFNNDLPGWFQENRAVALTEFGFIFLIMSDFNLPDFQTFPQVRSDWFTYWFVNESFPTPLGWHPNNPVRSSAFVDSVTSMITNAPLASTPAGLPAFATGPETDVPIASTTLTHTFALPTDAPYAAPGVVVKRSAGPDAAAVPAASAVKFAALASADAILGPAPKFKNPYKEDISPEEFAGQAAARATRMSVVQSILAEMTAAPAAPAAIPTGSTF